MLSLLLLSLFAIDSHADFNQDLFRIRKVIKPKNEIMLQSRLSDSCEVSDIDFMYYVNVNPSNGQAQEVRRLSWLAEGQFRKRFKLIGASESNAASCHGKSNCSAKALQTQYIQWVNHGLSDSSLVIRSEKTPAGCKSKALLDFHGKVAEVKGLKLNATNINEGFTSASFTIESIEVYLEGSKDPIIWRCEEDCDKTEGLL